MRVLFVRCAELNSLKPEARAEGMRFVDRKTWLPSACASGFEAGGVLLDASFVRALRGTEFLEARGASRGNAVCGT
jgi:hypothetical protein